MYKDDKTVKTKKGLRFSIQWKMVLIGVAVVAAFVALILGIILPGLQTSLMNEKRSETKQYVQTAYSLMTAAYAQQQSGALTEKQAQALASNEISQLRYGDDSSGYFFVIDTVPAMIMHPLKPTMDGESLTTYTDHNGSLMFVNMVNVCKQGGAGYVTYAWQYGTDQNEYQQKTSYVDEFTPWGWIVGTGIFTVDVVKQVSTARNEYMIIGAILAIICFFFIFFFSRVISKNIRIGRGCSQQAGNRRCRPGI